MSVYLKCYLGVRIAIPSNVTTASSPPAPTSATEIIVSRKTWYEKYYANL